MWFVKYSSTSQLLRNKIFAVYYKNNTEHINALCGYDAGILVLNHASTYSGPLKVEHNPFQGAVRLSS